MIVVELSNAVDSAGLFVMAAILEDPCPVLPQDVGRLILLDCEQLTIVATLVVVRVLVSSLKVFSIQVHTDILEMTKRLAAFPLPIAKVKRLAPLLVDARAFAKTAITFHEFRPLQFDVLSAEVNHLLFLKTSYRDAHDVVLTL